MLLRSGLNSCAFVLLQELKQRANRTGEPQAQREHVDEEADQGFEL